MTLREDVSPDVVVRPGIPSGLAGIGAVVVFVAVLSSSLVALLPAFRFESQFPAVVPVCLWVGAAGLGHLATFGRLLLEPWRNAFGLVSIVPWGAVLAVPAVAPDARLPWWIALVTAAAATAPFVVLSLRGGRTLALTEQRTVTPASLRGTFLIAVAVMLMVWALGGPPITGTIVGVLLALALAIAGLLPQGLAHATRAWSVRHWAALAWGSIVAWLTVPLAVTAPFMRNLWVTALLMVVAGLPLFLVNRADAAASPRSS